MTGFINYFGRNPFPDDYDRTHDFLGYTYLGPIMIPPVVPTVGMVDRNPAGGGTIWFLMWDGEQHLLLTNEYPMNFPQWSAEGLSEPFPQNTTIYQPWDGPYISCTGWRMGVTTAAVGQIPAGTPHLQFDAPNDPQNQFYTSAGPPLFAPYVLGPQTQTYPEPSNYPAPGVPAIPGIPSSTPPPTGGGYGAFLAAYATNTPPVINPANLPTIANIQRAGWHLQHYGG